MHRTQRITLVATGFGLFMIFLDALIVNVALPSIQAGFGVGEAGLQWVVAAYSLGMAVFIMTAATLADLDRDRERGHRDRSYARRRAGRGSGLAQHLSRQRAGGHPGHLSFIAVRR